MAAFLRSKVFAITFLAVLPAAAQDTVSVGNMTKHAFGTPVSFQNGDRGCLITFEDDRGRAFRELADFELCTQEKSLQGKRLALTYRATRVQSPSCQGDPDCKKSDTVVVVVAVKPTTIGTTPPQPPRPAPASPDPVAQAKRPASFCTPAETVVFSCYTNPSKLVSVCASKDAAPNRGYLQYRTGNPDAKTPIDLTLPSAQVPPPQAANGDSLSFSGGGGAWLRVSTTTVAFVVYTGIGKWGSRGEIREKAGVAVERDGTQVANLKCTGTPISLLGPDWFTKAGIQSGGRDFDLPE
ncbi:hypothetical protein [Reyranella sp.]|uniref:hypothetical protein n=1 Tax=Reyranella sp. TaxID=1929291 RepID=UPI003D0AAD59